MEVLHVCWSVRVYTVNAVVAGVPSFCVMHALVLFAGTHAPTEHKTQVECKRICQIISFDR